MNARLRVGDSYDAVIVGGGVGGLVAAAYLARARARVLVLEASGRFGGQAETMEVAGGIRAPFLAHTVWALDTQALKTLRLQSYGLEFAQPNMRLWALRPGGKHIQVPEQSFRARTALAARDRGYGGDYVAFHRETMRFARKMRPLWRGHVRKARVEEGEDTLAAVARWIGLSDYDAERLETLSRLSAAAYLDRWFDNDALKAALALDVFPSGLSPAEAGSALVLIWRYAQESSGRQAAVGQLRGGPGALATALAMAAADAGAELRTRARVNSILVERRRAVGVALESGEIIASRAVLSCLDRRNTLLGLISAVTVGFGIAATAPDFAKIATAQLIVMLNGLPPFAGVDRKELDSRLVFTRWPETASRAKTAALAGRLPEELVMEATVPTAADPSLAPGGIHVLSVLLPYLPATAAGGWEEQREPLRRQALAELEAFAPGLKDRVVAHLVLTPDDIRERTAHSGAAPSPWWRLISNYAARIRTPIAGLYLCGQTAEPVGALSGRAGRVAAELLVASWRDGRSAP